MVTNRCLKVAKKTAISAALPCLTVFLSHHGQGRRVLHSVHYIMNQLFSALLWQRANQHDRALRSSRYFCGPILTEQIIRCLPGQVCSYCTFSDQLVSSLRFPFHSEIRTALRFQCLSVLSLASFCILLINVEYAKIFQQGVSDS